MICYQLTIQFFDMNKKLIVEKYIKVAVRKALEEQEVKETY